MINTFRYPESVVFEGHPPTPVFCHGGRKELCDCPTPKKYVYDAIAFSPEGSRYKEGCFFVRFCTPVITPH